MTQMWLTNGFNRSIIRDLCFDMGSTTANVATDGTIGFNWNWDGGRGSGPPFRYPNNINVNTTALRLRSVKCRNATYGFLMGSNYPSVFPPNGSTINPNGNECDTVTVLGCFFENCYQGYSCWEANVIGHNIYSSTFTGCTSLAIRGKVAVAIVIGCTFNNNGSDFHTDGAVPLVAGCSSTSKYFVVGAPVTLLGCQHTGQTIYYSGGPGGFGIIDQCSSNGDIRGSGDVEIRDSVLTNASLFAPFQGILDFWGLPTGPISSLPASPILGMEQVITNANMATFGADIIAAGTGTGNVKGRWNGARWTVCGA